MKSIINLKDIKQFFKYLGFTWKGEIATASGDIVLIDASEITDGSPCRFKVYNDYGAHYQLAEITAINFALYDYAYFSDLDSVPSLVSTGNYSRKWIEYLTKKYGTDYKLYAAEECKSVIHSTIQSSINQVNELNQTKRKIISSTRKKLNELNSLLDMINADEQIEKR